MSVRIIEHKTGKKVGVFDSWLDAARYRRDVLHPPLRGLQPSPYVLLLDDEARDGLTAQIHRFCTEKPAQGSLFEVAP